MECHNLGKFKCTVDGTICHIRYTPDNCFKIDAEKQKLHAVLSNYTGWLCAECGENAPVPFDCGDGKIMCAACAVDTYMKEPCVKKIITIRPHSVLRTPGT